MVNPKNPIGIIDTGIGGLTVVKEIQKLMPNEDIIYIGDSKNCPYGNRSKAEIANLTENMLDFLKSKDVKIVGIACNTISSAINEYKDFYDFNIISIIYPAVEYITSRDIQNIGIFGTDFTIKTAYYDMLIKERCPNINVYSQSSLLLATMIDNGNLYIPEIYHEVTAQINKLLNQTSDLKDIILACTHYPIIEEIFCNLYPDVNFINPAYSQAKSIKNYLQKNSALNDISHNGDFKIYSTANEDLFLQTCKKLNLNPPSEISIIKL